MAFLLPGQPVQVRPHRVQGIEGHHGAARSSGSRSAVKWLVSLCLTSDLEVVQEAPAMLGDAEEVHPGAVGAAGPAGGLAVHGHGP